MAGEASLAESFSKAFPGLSKVGGAAASKAKSGFGKLTNSKTLWAIGLALAFKDEIGSAIDGFTGRTEAERTAQETLVSRQREADRGALELERADFEAARRDTAEDRAISRDVLNFQLGEEKLNNDLARSQSIADRPLSFSLGAPDQVGPPPGSTLPASIAIAEAQSRGDPINMLLAGGLNIG